MLPTVLSSTEVQRLLAGIDGETGLVVRLLYGTGMRVSECCTLRIRDVDFERSQIMVRQGKGNKDRVLLLPESIRGDLRQHLRARRELYERDLHRYAGYVPLPDSVPNRSAAAGREWGWQYVFASVTVRYEDDANGVQRGVRWHTTPRTSAGRLPSQRVPLGSPSASLRTRCGTASRRTCWSRGGTFGTCRLSWGIDPSRRR